MLFNLIMQKSDLLTNFNLIYVSFEGQMYFKMHVVIITCSITMFFRTSYLNLIKILYFKKQDFFFNVKDFLPLDIEIKGMKPLFFCFVLF